jgi:hypothetical protein
MSSYKISEPSALKFLKANGAVVDENGNVVNDASDYWKKVYDQAEPKVAKYLHADGTIDENPGSGGAGADLEDNHETTIDVSTYTEPVEIEPTKGKDGMKKATVTLTNIPSGGDDVFNIMITNVLPTATAVRFPSTTQEVKIRASSSNPTTIPSGCALSGLWLDTNFSIRLGDTIILDYGEDEYTCVVSDYDTNYEFTKSSS